MRNDLTAVNANTLYVVFNTKTNAVELETEQKIEAISYVGRNANTDFSIYPPFTYAANKKDLADLYETTMLEY